MNTTIEYLHMMYAWIIVFGEYWHNLLEYNRDAIYLWGTRLITTEHNNRSEPHHECIGVLRRAEPGCTLEQDLARCVPLSDCFGDYFWQHPGPHGRQKPQAPSDRLQYLRGQSGSHGCFSCCYRHELLHVGQYLGVLAVWADHVRCLDFLRLRNDVRVSFHSLHYLYWPVLGSELAYTLQVAQQHKESYWYGGWSLVSKFWKFSILLTNEMTYHTIHF